MIVRFKNRQQASKLHIDVMECDGSFKRWEKYLIQSTLQDNQLNIIIERVKVKRLSTSVLMHGSCKGEYLSIIIKRNAIRAQSMN